MLCGICEFGLVGFPVYLSVIMESASLFRQFQMLQGIYLEIMVLCE